jgi:Tol biopolymer transport system component
VSQAGVTALQSGAVNSQVYATIWLLNLYTLNATRIADQPANATLASGNLIKRTTEPVWSPDGGSIAWIESDTQGERLVVYSVSAKNAATYQLNLPAICCEGASRTIYWGQSGIAITGSEGTFNQPQQAVYVFSPQGQQLTKVILATDTFLQYGWALDSNNHEYLAGVTNGMFTVVDPFNNSGSNVQGYPELYSFSAPNDLAIRPSHNPALWTVTRQGQNVADLNNINDVRQMSISPDGQSVVYVQGDYLHGGSAFVVLANGQTVPLNPQKQLLAVTWGATSWRIRTS